MNNFIIYDLEEQNGNIRAIDDNTILQWIEHERNGRKIIICTDKSSSYIKGMLSVISNVNPIVIAENGAVVLWDTFQKKHIMPVNKESRNILNQLREKLEMEFPNIWFQDNIIGFTAYCDEIKCIKDYLDEMNLQNMNIIFEEKSVRVVPQNIDYNNAVNWLMTYMESDVKDAGEIKSEA